MHARALVKFFYEGRDRNAVFADLYFEGENIWSSRHRPRKAKSLERINPRVGEEIAHLSLSRTAAEVWDY